MDKLLQGLRAVAEPTRLRMIVLCGHAELSVGDFVFILGQSQPRVSRHLKLLVDAGLLNRNKEGSRAYYRLVASGKNSPLEVGIFTTTGYVKVERLAETPILSIHPLNFFSGNLENSTRADCFFFTLDIQSSGTLI